MADIGERLARLSPEERARVLAAARRRAAGDAPPTASTKPFVPTIKPRPPDLPTPLARAQERLWFLQLMAPESTAYNTAVGAWLRGTVQVELLESAFDALLRRHESLRSVVVGPDDAPNQKALPEWKVAVPVEQAPADATFGDPADANRLTERFVQQSFDLRRDLLIRAKLIRFAPDAHLLVIGVHHLACDGLSIDILYRDLSALYAERVTGAPADLPPLSFQFGDFAAWERSAEQHARLADHDQFWADYLRGAPPVLPLPVDLPRPKVQTYAGRRIGFDTGGAELAAALRDLCRRERTTPYLVLLTAFAATLGRWTGQQDLVLGTPVANRDYPGAEHMVAFFNNTLPVRVGVPGNPTLRELLVGVRGSALRAFEHQQVPFERVVEVAAPPRSAAYNPLFQVNFRVRTQPLAAPNFPGVAATAVAFEVGFSRFDLALEAHAYAERVGGYVEYNTALFHEETAVAVAVAFGETLARMVSEPDTRYLDVQPVQSAARRTSAIPRTRR
ncbi:MAG: condensation domain-containing protein [Acidothermaceae bacterium]